MAVFTGRRIYDNNVQGTVSDNPLSNVATTLNSSGLANLSAVSSNHAVLVLDPLRTAGAPEIVIVTAHTGSATSATISRGAYGTSARQHASGTPWVHPATKDDLIRILTSATRPSDQYEGQLIYETDTNRLALFGGTDWAYCDAGGKLGYTPKTTTQTGITTETDLTSLSATVTVPTGRLIRVTGYVYQFARTAGTVTYTELFIHEGATRLGTLTIPIPNTYGGGLVSTLITPSAGSHTYKLKAATDGTVTMQASSIGPAYILVEDIGAA